MLCLFQNLKESLLNVSSKLLDFFIHYIRSFLNFYRLLSNMVLGHHPTKQLSGLASIGCSQFGEVSFAFAFNLVQICEDTYGFRFRLRVFLS